VLWRWCTQDAESKQETMAAGDESQLDLCWIEVPASAGAGGSFSLAESIIAAESRKVRETS